VLPEPRGKVRDDDILSLPDPPEADIVSVLPETVTIAEINARNRALAEGSGGA
jgi:hypothetical protein